MLPLWTVIADNVDVDALGIFADFGADVPPAPRVVKDTAVRYMEEFQARVSGSL